MKPIKTISDLRDMTAQDRSNAQNYILENVAERVDAYLVEAYRTRSDEPQIQKAITNAEREVVYQEYLLQEARESLRRLRATPEDDRLFVTTEGRTTGRLHASSLGACPFAAQMDYLRVPPLNRVSSHLRKIFDVGHALHKLYQGYFLAALGEEVFCMEQFADTRELPDPDDPDNRTFECRMAGSTDGIITLPYVRLGLEIKTASDKGWDSVKSKPMPKHHAQRLYYQWAFNLPFMLFLYLNKNNQKDRYLLVDYSREMFLTEVCARAKEVVCRDLDSPMAPPKEDMFSCDGCGYFHVCPAKRKGRL